MHNFLKLWRTTTVRLTALFIVMFVLFSLVLLGYVGFQSSIEIQRVQARDVFWEIRQLRNIDRQRGPRALAIAVQRLSNQPGRGIYYLGNPAGEMLAGNFRSIPSYILLEPGQYSFSYSPQRAFEGLRDPVEPNSPEALENSQRGQRDAQAVVRSIVLESGFRLVVGRDIVQRRDFTRIIVRTMMLGVIGIILLAAAAGILTARRVLARIDSINATTRQIMAGNMSERVPITKRDDEFDQLATGLNEMLDRIEMLMQGLKEVTDNVAHDLKTPLTRLRNMAEAALRDGSSNEDHKKVLEKTITESDRLISTFNALLLIARVEAGSHSDALKKVDVSRTVIDICDLYSPVVEDAGGTLVMDIEPDIYLNSNRELLSQALVNLLENAIKYSLGDDNKNSDNLDGNKISVGVKTAGGNVRISVCDGGPGIPASEGERVLQRFVRLEKSRTESGSGLGLALVAAVAKLHRGSFKVEDNPSRGTSKTPENPGVCAIISLPKTP
ncbi:MAG: HAMP domain-containing histidine kinase [Devosiaceae bacterium]|nr:HAMP domain-containing histidine kinase [Devosiaceae bacterium]